MSRPNKAAIKQIAEWHSAIQEPGTPEMGYTDSGLWTFLADVYTKDGHEETSPVKPLPVADKVYLQIVFLYMLTCKVLALPKSRQMIISWAVSAFDVWSAMRAPYREVIYQTQKEEDAHAMVSEGHKNPRSGRMDFIIQHLPKGIRDPHIMGGIGNRVGELVFSPNPVDKNGVPVPWYGSKIKAVPGGAGQVRGKTPYKFTFDESAFHDDFGEAWAAVKPAVTGGGTVHAISSVSAGSDFNALVLESPSGRRLPHCIHPVVQRAMGILGIEWPKGMRSWKTPSGTWVLEIHYMADPAKDPERDGAEWFAEAVEGYIGGTDSPLWQREMEINYEAGGGDPVFPYLTDGHPKIYIPRIAPKDAMSRFDLFAGYDYGTVNPSHFVVGGFDRNGEPYALWELEEPAVNLKEHCEKIKACPYWKYIKYIVCDPSITAKTQQTATGLRSIAEQFVDHGITFIPGRRGAAEPTAARFNGEYWADPMNPRAYITQDCPILWKQLQGLKRDLHQSASTSMRKNALETIMDKDNHGTDAWFYLIDSRPTPKALAPKEPGELTFDQFFASSERGKQTTSPYAIKVV